MFSLSENPLSGHPNVRWLILTNTLIGAFMANLDASIVNVALPTIAGKMNVSMSVIQWVVTAYLLAVSSSLLLFGRLADMIGRRKVFSSGFLVFTLGSLFCAFSGNIWQLVASRLLQSLGASTLMAIAPAIVTSSFGPQERGKALGINATTVAVGGLIGPPIGGFLVSSFGWTSIFYINLPLGIFGYIFALMVIPPDTLKNDKESFDFLGATLFALGMISLLFGINNGQEWGWNSAIILSIIAGLILLATFFFLQTRVQHPMLDLSIFKVRPLFFGNLSSLLFYTATFCNSVLMPFYLQRGFNYSPSKIGLIMMSLPLTMAVLAPITGHVSDRIGALFLTSSGLIAVAAGFLTLSLLTVTSTVPHMLFGLILIGIGSAMFISPNNNSVMSCVTPQKLGVASGIYALVRNVGMITGIALSVSLFEGYRMSHPAALASSVSSERIDTVSIAYHLVMLAAMLIALAGAAVSFKRGDRENPRKHRAAA